MPRIIFIEHDGVRHELSARSGQTVMEIARDNNVRGILAECGGACACATCHVRVDDAWSAKVGSPSETEAAMLEFAQNPGPTSRLSCQMTVIDDWDGLILRVPDTR